MLTSCPTVLDDPLQFASVLSRANPRGQLGAGLSPPLDPLGELDLFLGSQQRHVPDRIEVQVNVVLDVHLIQVNPYFYFNLIIVLELLGGRLVTIDVVKVVDAGGQESLVNLVQLLEFLLGIREVLQDVIDGDKSLLLANLDELVDGGDIVIQDDILIHQRFLPFLLGGAPCPALLLRHAVPLSRHF